jgi:putative transposase
MKTFYRQRLPHIQPVGATFFVTYRLFGSIPYPRLKSLKEEYHTNVFKAKKILDLKQRNSVLYNLRRRYLYQTDELVHDIKSGPTHLSDNIVMANVKEILHRFDGEFYTLLCYCVMSNHVHILIDTSIQIDEDDYFENQLEGFTSLDSIMKRLKAPVSRFANKHLARSGQFWERESYDIYIRNEKMLNNIITYILENPVKAKMVENWNDYPGNYLKM